MANQSRISILAVVFLSFTVLPISVIASDAFLTLQELDVGMQALKEKVFESHSFYIDFDITSERHNEADSTAYMGGFHYRIGRMGESWYTYLEGSSEPLRMKADKWWIFHKGVSAEFIDGRVIKKLLVGRETESTLYDSWYYTDNLSLYPYDYLADSMKSTAWKLHKDNRMPSRLPDAFQGEKVTYNVRSALEDVGGVPCHVVEVPMRDIVWIAHGRSFLPMKRTLYYEPVNGQNVIDRTIYQENLKEVQPGLWLPMEQKIEYYPNPAVDDKRFWNDLGCVRRFQVRDMLFDTLNDGFFNVSVPVGTRVHDGIRGKEYVVRDLQEKPLEGLVQVIEAEENFAQKNGRYSIFLVCNVVICIVLLAIILAKRLRKRS